MQLHLIRHGQTDWNAVRRIQGQTDSQLDETGFAQATSLHDELLDTPFSHAYVSSSLRTRQTADTVFDRRDVPMSHSDDLREMRLGRWEGQLWPDVEDQEPDRVRLYQAFDDAFVVEGAERLDEMQQRGVDAVEGIIRHERGAGTDPTANIAIVSHGFLLRAIFAHYLKLPLQAFAGSAPLPNCAHSILDVVGDRRQMRTIAGEPPDSGLWASVVAAPPG